MFDSHSPAYALSLAQDDASEFEKHRLRMIEIAMFLEEKGTLPVVKAQLAYWTSQDLLDAF